MLRHTFFCRKSFAKAAWPVICGVGRTTIDRPHSTHYGYTWVWYFETMTYYQGRLINHIHLRVSDLAHSKSFYRAVLQAIGLEDTYRESERCFYADELYVDQADDYVSRVHLAFQATSHEAVDQSYTAAVGAGGTDNGKPGQRNYHSHYYVRCLRSRSRRQQHRDYLRRAN